MKRIRDKSPQDTLNRFLRMCSPEPNSGCWIWTGPIKPNGYGQFSIGKKSIMAHRAALQLHGRPETGEVAMHKCHNKWCVNPEHIEYGTQKKNWHDANTLGVTYRGERQHLAKITAADVRAIRESNMASAELARRMSINPNIVYGVRQGRTWKHVV
jgi:hypothetical protein